MTGTLTEDGAECDRPIMMQKIDQALDHLEDASPKVSLGLTLESSRLLKAHKWRLEVCNIGSFDVT